MIGELIGQPSAMIATERAPAEDREEIRWVARAKAGDMAGVQWLLDRYRVRAVRLATHILRREGEAEDVAQEACIRAFQKLGHLKEDAGFAPWLYRTVLHVCLDRQRLRRWHSEVSAETLSDTFNHAGCLADDVERRLMVEMLLDQLSPQMRAALVLRELEGLEYEEIAQVLNIPLGTVRSRIHAARAQFRALWLDAGKEV